MHKPHFFHFEFAPDNPFYAEHPEKSEKNVKKHKKTLNHRFEFADKTNEEFIFIFSKKSSNSEVRKPYKKMHLKIFAKYLHLKEFSYKNLSKRWQNDNILKKNPYNFVAYYQVL